MKLKKNLIILLALTLGIMPVGCKRPEEKENPKENITTQREEGFL